MKQPQGEGTPRALPKKHLSSAHKVLEKYACLPSTHPLKVELTNGFTALTPCITSLPSPFNAWDKVATQLPDLLARGKVNQTVDALPNLSVEKLPSQYLNRAALVLGTLSHACLFEQKKVQPLNGENNDDTLLPPACLWKPWQAVCKRLDRTATVLTLNEVVRYNWKLRDPKQPIQIENLELQIPTFGNEEERIFYMSILESEALGMTIIKNIALAQDAVLNDDPDELIKIMRIINQCIDDSVTALKKISLNRHNENYVNSIRWAVTFAAFTQSFSTRALSGEGSYGFGALDSYFERVSYQSKIGQETKKISEFFPLSFKEFIIAIEDVSISDFIKKHKHTHPQLEGYYHTGLKQYLEFVDLHRRMVFGIMDVALKGANRFRTNGRMTMDPNAQGHNALDKKLSEGIKERTQAKTYFKAMATGQQIAPDVAHITLDINETGIEYQPGDRVSIFPLNDEKTIQEMCKTLSAHENTIIELTPNWKKSASDCYLGTVNHLPITTFLRYAHLRPIKPEHLKQWYYLTNMPELKSIIDADRIDQYSIHDIITLLKEKDFDVSVLLNPNSDFYLSRFLDPNQARLYSISSALENNKKKTLDIVIGQLSYQPIVSEWVPQKKASGTASTYLHRTLEKPIEVLFNTAPADNFRLPSDSEKPIILFAGGTGFAPFRSFIQQRAYEKQDGKLVGKILLFFSIKTEKDLLFKEELEHYAKMGILIPYVTLSRQDNAVTFDGATKKFVFQAGKKGRIDQLFKNPSVVQAFNEAVHTKQGIIYICGSIPFASSVYALLKSTFCTKAKNDELFSSQSPHLFYKASDPSIKMSPNEQQFMKWISNGRIREDIFATYLANEHLPMCSIAEIAKHNNSTQGYWTIIRGYVYDLTLYGQKHPGGDSIVIQNAGMDSTGGYDRVHKKHSQVHAELENYKIGRLNIPDFMSKVLTQDINTDIDRFKNVYISYVDCLHYIVVAENILTNVKQFSNQPLVVYNQETEPFSLLRGSLLGNIHQTHIEKTWGFLVQERLPKLIKLTQEFEEEPNASKLNNLLATLNGINQSKNAQLVFNTTAILKKYAHLSGSDLEKTEQRQGLVRSLYQFIKKQDADVLKLLKKVISNCIELLETYQEKPPQKRQEEWNTLLLKLPSVLGNYYDSIATYQNEDIQLLIMAHNDIDFAIKKAKQLHRVDIIDFLEISVSNQKAANDEKNEASLLHLNCE